MAGWENFFIAQVGASAALAGLVFVSISINLSKIMSSPTLPGRAFEPLALLLSVLILSTLLLVPDQAVGLVGVEVLVVGVLVWLTINVLLVNAWRTQERRFRGFLVPRAAMAQISTLPFVAAGLALLTQGASGLVWIVPGVIFSFLTVFIDAWVLLVEINR